MGGLGGVEVHDLASAEVGDTFRVFVGESGDDPAATLVLTDGNGWFGLALDLVRLMRIPGLVGPIRVVGVGYPGVSWVGQTIPRRNRDLTPTASRHFAGSGGAAAFTHFLRHDLFGWLADRYGPAGLTRTVYFGHSLGGQFGAHLLLEAPSSFDGYILSSPSLWWDHHRIFEVELQYAERHRDLVARVHLGIGALETDAGRRLEAAALPADDPWKPPATHLDMVEDLTRFAAALAGRGYPGLDLSSAVYPDEFHATAPPVVLTHGLRRLLPQPAASG